MFPVTTVIKAVSPSWRSRTHDPVAAVLPCRGAACGACGLVWWLREVTCCSDLEVSWSIIPESSRQCIRTSGSLGRAGRVAGCPYKQGRQHTVIIGCARLGGGGHGNRVSGTSLSAVCPSHTSARPSVDPSRGCELSPPPTHTKALPLAFRVFAALFALPWRQSF